MRSSILMTLVLAASVARAEPYVAPAASSVPNYSATVLPCKIDKQGDLRHVVCTNHELEQKTLRELAILRNTIYARYGWSGFRKPWLRDYFAAQPWFRPNPAFNYKLVSDVDKQNAHLIAAAEQFLTGDELARRRSDVFARHGKVWNDVPRFDLDNGKQSPPTCKRPKNAVETDDGPNGGQADGPDLSNDCYYRALPWYHADRSYTDARLTAEDRIELGLISRASGSFTLDGSIDYDQRGKSNALDKLLPVAELRQLSMRDLRLLRNTIYARRGRAFKSDILREHFQGQSWYKLDPAYSDKRLTATDTRNIALIKSVENEFGGPLSDEDWLTEPTTDGA